jgi:hypothetical protein
MGDILNKYLVEVRVDLILDGPEVYFSQQVEEHFEELLMMAVHVEVPLRQHYVPNAHFSCFWLML